MRATLILSLPYWIPFMIFTCMGQPFKGILIGAGCFFSFIALLVWLQKSGAACYVIQKVRETDDG